MTGNTTIDPSTDMLNGSDVEQRKEQPAQRKDMCKRAVCVKTCVHSAIRGDGVHVNETPLTVQRREPQHDRFPIPSDVDERDSIQEVQATQHRHR
jgi:hypothetical protein